MPIEVAVTTLDVDAPLKETIYSADGEPLLRRGKLLKRTHLAVFTEEGISSVFMRAPQEPEEICSETLRFEKKSVLEIGDGDVIGMPVTDERGRLLVQAGRELSRDHRDNLLRQGVDRVQIRRKTTEEYRKRTQRLCMRLSEIPDDEATTGFGKVFNQLALDRSRVVADASRLEATRLLDTDDQTHPTVRLDPGIRSLIEPGRLDAVPGERDTQRVLRLRHEFFEATAQVLAKLRAQSAVEGKDIEEIVRSVIERLVGDRFHRLHLVDPRENEYLASHLLTTTVLAINMAARLEYAREEVLELGYCAMLHDIGMLKAPQALQTKRGEFTASERRQLQTHPSSGIELLCRVRDLPMTAPVAVLQSHERLDGSGYPRGRRGERVHPFARIISVAACYDAMTRDRPWRLAKQPYDVMCELLNEVRAGRLCPQATKALLETLGLFPIGSGVELTDGRKGYVLDAAGASYTRPVVALTLGRDGKPLAKPEIVDLLKAPAETRIAHACAAAARNVTVRAEQLPVCVQ